VAKRRVIKVFKGKVKKQELLLLIVKLLNDDNKEG
jgi:hypothetical protein